MRHRRPDPLHLDNKSDANGVTDYTYDDLKRLIHVTQDLGGADPGTADTLSQYQYDTADNLTTVTDPKGHATIYRYDDLGNKLSVASPDTGSTHYTYDEAGNTRTRADARGIHTIYTYDVLNRLTAIHYQNANQNVMFNYDETDVANGIGQLTRMTDPSGDTRYHYNAHGELTGEHRTIDTMTHAIGYHYGPAGRLNKMSYPSGRSVAYTYGGAGRIEQVTTTDTEGDTGTLASGITYYPFGPLKELTFGNGIVMSRGFDQAYRQTGQMAMGQNMIQDLFYTPGPTGNIDAIIDNLVPGRDQDFTYDALNRLDTADGVYGTRDYDHDPVGNRTKVIRNGDIDDYTIVPASNRLQAVTGANPESYGYDDAGNITTKGALSLDYNQQNRLITVTEGSGQIATYSYNGKGERVKKIAGDGTTYYHYSRTGQLIAETGDSGNILKEYIYLEGSLIALIAPPATSPPATTLTVSADTPPPHPEGTAVTYTASADGGSGSYEYKFWLKGPSTGNTYFMVQDWGADTYILDTTGWVGSNTLKVETRNAGS
ncbi:MAG: RHS repeat protein, partial [Gammaproteobacteria bacterium]|nr:RHS repeat protein [Gammaproteobacteria bacterium]